MRETAGSLVRQSGSVRHVGVPLSAGVVSEISRLGVVSCDTSRNLLDLGDRQRRLTPLFVLDDERLKDRFSAAAPSPHRSREAG
jgi:hypothetical protein